jgi:hypothetical protein
MVKQSVSFMGTFFTRERFGRAQIFAGLLLLVFIAECLWLVAHQPPDAISDDEFAREQAGLAQWQGRGIAGTAAAIGAPRTQMQGDPYDPDHSPLWYLIGSAPVAVFRVAPNSTAQLWLTRLPYVLFGTLLGASLWYVSRRLYGNAGGYIALGLYCFSPALIRNSALWFAQPDIAAAWGTFGAVFTAIAVSHTLYAPREVVLWNWRRILLLGISLALAVGSQFSLVIVIPMLAAFMLYLAHQRRAAAIVILAASCVIGLLLLFSAYSFHPRLFWQGLAHARLLDVSGRAAGMPGAYLQVIKEVAASGPVLVLLTPVALVAYTLWQRSRYFGNTAPLIVALLFAALRVAAPHDPESVFSLTAVIFLFVFVAGIAADLLETKARELVTVVLVGLLAANGLWNLIGLARIAR